MLDGAVYYCRPVTDGGSRAHASEARRPVTDGGSRAQASGSEVMHRPGASIIGLQKKTYRCIKETMEQ